ncbi:T9SS C-terminal target domain-containing protein [Chryseobacterium sp. G0186]|uniref:GEVED domain-containing protein n=1 Tax=Chryseobacterium sp. G0186 TaxID=2487064 RepID=UPI000F4E92A9|nr:GEVED domain-containing protein [Chryseobacterium sp. G0186]AZA79008.1 T9SS C-terminal target domain-containing protein [Chryseobacterium sp. G0186]
MKKMLLVIMPFLGMMISAQELCGFDQVQQELEMKNPEIQKAREEAEARFLKMDVKEYLNKVGATSKNGQYTGPIYEIPVVVHVIESSAASNASFALTDAQIQTWIENCNKMYATTYGNGFFPEGNGIDDGNVIPFKLVLAKRTPQCTSTNGIIRYNGSIFPEYDTKGMRNSGTTGPTASDIIGIAPHWAENYYYNIYLVIGFDSPNGGINGWSGFPANPDKDYHSFMKVAVVKNTHSVTLAHEFAHSIGLYHPFNGISTNPSSPQASDCPDNSDCTTKNDRVCDTEPTASLLNVSPFPSNTDVNPCTALPYQGIQYNIMNYTSRRKKFTSGQRDRGVAMFMQSRSSLTTSLGGTDLTTNPSPLNTLAASACNPAGVNNGGNYGMGPRRVQLGSIDFRTSSSSGLDYYVDYSLLSCINPSVYTDLSTTSNQLKVSITNYSQFVKAWIDYNNNGIFEASELIGASPGRVSVGASPYVITFTPPVDAVKDTYLRMRIIADDSNNTPCQNLSYGQVEDYAVRILGLTLNTNEVKKSDSSVHYSENSNSLILVNGGSKKFGAYEIYDISGKLLQKGKSDTNEIKLIFSNKGIYVLTFTANGQKVSKKFMQ